MPVVRVPGVQGSVDRVAGAGGGVVALDLASGATQWKHDIAIDIREMRLRLRSQDGAFELLAVRFPLQAPVRFDP